MPSIMINDQPVIVAEGTTVLEAAREQKIEIPTLCYNPALEPYGGCRLCVVEVEAGGRPGLQASCTLRATEATDPGADAGPEPRGAGAARHGPGAWR